MDVVRLEPSKSSIYATPFGSPVAELLMGFGFGNTCAISPSIENADTFSVSMIGRRSNARVKPSKSS